MLFVRPSPRLAVQNTIGSGGEEFPKKADPAPAMHVPSRRCPRQAPTVYYKTSLGDFGGGGLACLSIFWGRNSGDTDTA